MSLTFIYKRLEGCGTGTLLVSVPVPPIPAASATPFAGDPRGKLRLNLDQLTVDSFDTATPVREKGTVFGEQCSCDTVCSCPGCPTCVVTECNDATCYTCGLSCGGSCFYTECPGTNPTCDPSNFDPRQCCPY